MLVQRSFGGRRKSQDNPPSLPTLLAFRWLKKAMVDEESKNAKCKSKRLQDLKTSRQKTKVKRQKFEEKTNILGSIVRKLRE
jgi:hypothetical protein